MPLLVPLVQEVSVFLEMLVLSAQLTPSPTVQQLARTVPLTHSPLPVLPHAPAAHLLLPTVPLVLMQPLALPVQEVSAFQEVLVLNALPTPTPSRRALLPRN